MDARLTTRPGAALKPWPVSPPVSQRLLLGPYNLDERIDEHFAALHLGGNAMEYDVLADSELKSGDFGAWNQVMTLARADLSINANYQRLMGNSADGSRNPGFPVLLDLANLVDYMVV